MNLNSFDCQKTKVQDLKNIIMSWNSKDPVSNISEITYSVFNDGEKVSNELELKSISSQSLDSDEKSD